MNYNYRICFIFDFKVNPMKFNELYFNTNKATWNERAPIHFESEMYNVNAFIEGKTSLNSYELDALGNVNGKTLLHLQCHFGQDTLSWSREGAKCIGVDISDKSIALAKQLNAQLKLEAQFVCCNVLETSQHISQTFDIVFTSYGVIGWLPDLKPWGQMIAQRLSKGGVFFMAEFHPIVWMFDYLQTPPVLRYGYNQKQVIYEQYEGTYADKSSKMISKDYCWNHGMGDVVTALTEAGLHVEYLKEYNESPYNVLPNLIQTQSGYYKHERPLYPLIFTIKAIKV